MRQGSLARYPKHCVMLTRALTWPQLLALVGIRKGLERIFSLHDLSWLDSLLPTTARGEAEGKRPGKRSEESSGEAVGDAPGARLLHTFWCGGRARRKPRLRRAGPELPGGGKDRQCCQPRPPLASPSSRT